MGFFKKISDALKKTKEAFSRKLDSLLSHGELNEDFFEELTDILVSSDIGYATSEQIVEQLRTYARKNKLRTGEQVKQALKTVIRQIIDQAQPIEIQYPCVITLVGVNGVGKTTTVGKLTNFFKQNKKEVVLVAGDTFRAAANEQLALWAEKNKVRLIKHGEGADAAAVVFDGIVSAKSKKTDVLLVDTAGRLHTKTNLMQELEKIGRIISREYPQAHQYTFLVIDATTGQNAISQLETFDDYVELDGIVLTKLDGTAKGGIVITIASQTKLPVVFVGTGEKLEDLELFDSQEYVDNLY